MTLLNSVASTVNSYTDLTPPAGTVYYMIEAVNPSVCDPSYKSGNTIVSAISNIANTGLVGTSEFSNDESIRVFPNPTTGEITICGLPTLSSDLDIYNSLGQKIYSVKSSNQSEIIDISGFSQGVYFLVIKNNDYTSYKKIVLQ